MAYQHILGYLVPYHGMVDLHKEGVHNQGYNTMGILTLDESFATTTAEFKIHTEISEN